MSEPVFVDASAWIAITNRKDRNRGEAVKIFQRLLRTSTALVTTNWTAYEALTIVKSRLGFSQAERLWQRVISRAVVELVAGDEQIEKMLWNFCDGTNKTWAWSTVGVLSLWKLLVPGAPSLMTSISSRPAANSGLPSL